VVARDDVDAVVQAAERAKIPAWMIGEVHAGKAGVRFSER
jgi:hypothetical protein